MFVIHFDVYATLTDADDFTAEGVTLPKAERRTLRRPLSKDNIDWLMNDLKAMGFPKGKTLRALDPFDGDAFDFSDKEIVLQCVHKVANNDPSKTFEEWRLQRPLQKASKEQKTETFAELDSFLGTTVPF